MKHDHPSPCNHEALKFCAKCDAIECSACGAEWQKPRPYTPPCFRRHVPEPYMWTYTTATDGTGNAIHSQGNDTNRLSAVLTLDSLSAGLQMAAAAGKYEHNA